MGGQDSEGPIEAGTPGCNQPTTACCGLADFTVPTDFEGPQPGRPGTARRQRAHRAAAATTPSAASTGDTWVGDVASGGSAGRAGSGGGGGGAGGGAVMNWHDCQCEFADGLGGGGGGGGSGGCGGNAGSPGTSGAPSVAMLFRYTGGAPARCRRCTNVILAPCRRRPRR